MFRFVSKSSLYWGMKVHFMVALPFFARSGNVSWCLIHVTNCVSMQQQHCLGTVAGPRSQVSHLLSTPHIPGVNRVKHQPNDNPEISHQTFFIIAAKHASIHEFEDLWHCLFVLLIYELLIAAQHWSLIETWFAAESYLRDSWLPDNRESWKHSVATRR